MGRELTQSFGGCLKRERVKRGVSDQREKLQKKIEVQERVEER